MNAPRPGAPTGGEASDEDLALRAQEGALPAFEELIGRFESRLYRFIMKRTGNHHDAEDILQNTFLKAHLKIRSYNPAYRFSTWIYTIANRTAISHCRKYRRAGEFEAEQVESEDPSIIASKNESARSLWDQAREHLSELQHTALWLHYGEGLPVKEIATVMRKSQTNVKVHLHRARKSLAGHLELATVKEQWGFQSPPPLSAPKSYPSTSHPS